MESMLHPSAPTVAVPAAAEDRAGAASPAESTMSKKGGGNTAGNLLSSIAGQMRVKAKDLMKPPADEQPSGVSGDSEPHPIDEAIVDEVEKRRAAAGEKPAATSPKKPRFGTAAK